MDDVIVLGFGSWSTVNKLPTLGFGSSAVVVQPNVPGMEFVTSRNALHFVAPRNALHFTRDDD